MCILWHRYKLRGQTKTLLKYIIDMSGAEYDRAIWGKQTPTLITPIPPLLVSNNP